MLLDVEGPRDSEQPDIPPVGRGRRDPQSTHDLGIRPLSDCSSRHVLLQAADFKTHPLPGGHKEHQAVGGDCCTDR
jgi:hypothetical protein